MIQCFKIKINKFLILGVFLFALFGFVHAAQAATYYVATNGSDANTGTLSQPFRTLQKAADIVNPGDTVIVRDGVYGAGGKQYPFILSRPGTPTNWITFKAENKWKAVLDGEGAAYNTVEFRPNAAYIRIENFEIKNAYYSGIAIDSDRCPGCHDIYIKGNIIHDIGNRDTSESGGITGIEQGVGIHHTTYEDNLFYSIGRNPAADPYHNHDHGIYAYGDDITIINNVFRQHKAGWGIQLAPGANNVKILNNTFIDPNPYIDGQIILWGNHANITIKNNIFYLPNTDAIALYPYDGSGNTNVVIQNNLIYGVTNILPSGTTGGQFITPNNIIGNDPKFVNASAGNFRLQSNSPAINAGATLGSPYNVDFDGILRPQGSAYDIGAYEYVSGGTPTPPPAGGSADLNSDGRVNSVDAAILMGAWGQTSKPKADINQDGVVNSVDASLMMGQWTP